MANPQRLPKNLRDALGTPASEDLAVIVDEIRADAVGIERRLVAHLDGMEARLGARLDRLTTRVDALETRMTALETRMTALETRMTVLEKDMAELRLRLAETKADLMKWSFVFWVGAVTAIAVLAGVLR